MKQTHLFFIFCLFLSTKSYAQFWSFTAPVDITHGQVDKVYHHLESSGRRNIAVSANTVAVVWEDDRSGKPSVYLALKNKNEDNFNAELKISGDGEAYEPSIIALAKNRFALSWEEDGKVYVRVINAEQLKNIKLATVIQLPAEEAMQSSLSFNGHQLFVTLSQRVEHYNQIQLLQLNVDHQGNLKLLKNCRVDPRPVKNEQLYPTAIIVKEGIMIAWEDRRKGHTIIMGALSQSDDFCQFPPPQRISQRPGARKMPYGKGYGVARVALGHFGQSEVLAAWADKRNFRDGYDIYASVYDKSGIWGTNQSVQDDFGGVARQWHTTVTDHSNGRQIIAWSDEREGNSDIFYSCFDDGEWSDDLNVPGASGVGEQTHPSIILDDEGDLHVAWVLRKEVGGMTRLRYTLGRLN